MKQNNTYMCFSNNKMNCSNRDIWWTSRYTLLYGETRDIHCGAHNIFL